LPIPLDNAHVEPFPFSLDQPLLLFMIRPRPIPTSPPYSQPLPRASCPTCGHQFTLWRLTHHYCSYQTSNSSNPKPMWPSWPNTLHYSDSTYILGFDIGCPRVLPFMLSSSSIIQPHPCCSTTWCTSSIAFDKLAQDLYHVVAWHFFPFLPQWYLFSPFGMRQLGIRKCRFDSNTF
jgi:hypothetical protein